MNTDNLTIAPIYNDECKCVIDLILPIQQIEFNVPITMEGQPDLLDIEDNYQFNDPELVAILEEVLRAYL